ncbi:MAG: hypothetical protein ACRCV3_00055 [Desulfovibrionaceae bacterium]
MAEVYSVQRVSILRECSTKYEIMREKETSFVLKIFTVRILEMIYARS